ncbi:hypothetical protein [Salinisphaera sp. G21_0]|nr:hypothetical protein [Salinisphaera sp. G21_0]
MADAGKHFPEAKASIQGLEQYQQKDTENGSRLSLLTFDQG